MFFNSIFDIMQIILQTPRLLLRHITETDAPLVYALNTSPGVLQYVHEPTLKDEADALRVIKEIILPQYSLYNLGRWAIERKEDNQFMGWCGLKYLADINEVDLGYRLMPAYWGKGYATEAARHTLQFGFDQRSLQTIVGRVHINNLASAAVLEKIGMQYQYMAEEDGETIKVYEAHNPIS
jgi:[ribosomal protein S5]-alanine N-acetyltransferase